MPPSYNVNGKTALVTGAARGIGFETARALYLRGANVVITDLDDDAVATAAEQLGERALGIAADVTDTAAMKSVVATAVERFGSLDIAVANAGIAPSAPRTVRASGFEEFERVIAVDLLGVWRTVHAVVPQIAERGGHIVVIASVYAFLNGSLNAPYAMSKAGVEALGRSLRVELVPHGASASVAYFGFIDTKMVQDAFEDPLAKRFEDRIPKLLSKRLQPSVAGEAIARAIERRAQTIIEPKRWRVLFALRGVLNPILDRYMERDRELQEFARLADEPDRETA